MDARQRRPVLKAWQRRILVRLATCIVPETATASAQSIDAMVDAVDGQLQPRPRLQQIAFKLLLLGLGWMTLLPAGWQASLLHLLEAFPIRLVRVGIWGLKTLIYLGYYGQESVQQRINYLPSKLEGNVLLHARRLPGRA
ncbi:hypothetical protein [Reyranella soli]|uniref:Uncharacterized protein n=1 Tax=Reyranella soli TaxID=1230389 RepID=A0A512NCF5_9HYPH|nr:hypothetical protein [Reyranella soli]GEP56633.1 hypothetical protein RSO01_37990 [Reyranella soli]